MNHLFGKSLLLTSLFAILFLSGTTVFAQTNQPEGEEATVLSSEAPTLRFENLNLEDGMAQYTAEDIMQDSLGYMWIATQGGLHRYNGYEFEHFAPTPFDSTSLSNVYVTALEEASNGNIWVGTISGLNLFEPKSQSFTHFHHDPADSTTISGYDISDIHRAKSGDLWVATRAHGLSRLPEGESNQFRRYYHDPDNSNSLSSNQLWQISEDKNGDIWIGSRTTGVSRINTETDKITRYLQKNKTGFSIKSQHHPPDDPKTVWLATDNGIVELHTETGDYTRHLPPGEKRNGKSNLDLEDFIPDPETPGVLWAVGNNTGLVHFDVQTKEYTIYRHDPRNPNSIADNSALSITSDRTGKIWIGHQTEGTSQFTPSSANFSHIRHNPDDAESIGPNGVWKIYEDQNGILWAGTGHSNEFYLNRINLETGQVTRYNHEQGNVTGGQIQAMHEDHTGRFWVGSSVGLNHFDRSEGKATRFQKKPPQQYNRDNMISDIISSNQKDDELWLSTLDGIKRFDAQNGEIIDVTIEGKSEVNQYVADLFYDSRGDLWAASTSGLVKVDPDGKDHTVYQHDPADTTSISMNFILAIAQREHEPDILWLATAGGGLNRFDISTGEAIHFTMEDGLPDDNIYGILVDDRGTLWMSTNRGISNFDPSDNSFNNYGLEDGLIQLEFSQFAFEKGSNGVLYFGHKDGITAFNPEELDINTTPPQVVISDFQLLNESVSPGPDSPFDEPIEQEDQIIIDHDQSEVTFKYAGLHYSNAAKNQYKYQLEGFDEQWVDAGTRRTATYTNLAPGEYTFNVQASNADDIWNEEGASVKLAVLPPWYRTWWAYGFYLLAFGGIIFGIDRLQRKRLLRIEREKAREKELEQAKEIEKAYKELEVAHEDLKAAQTQLVQQEKLASLGQLTAGIAHEIKNPLNFVNNFSELSVELIEEAKEEMKNVRADRDTPQLNEALDEVEALLDNVETNLEKIHEHGSRADSIVKSMLQHSRGGSNKMEPTDLNVLIEEYVNLSFHGMRASKNPINVEIQTELNENVGEILLIAEDFSRVIVNLCNNAFDAMREKANGKSETADEYQPKLTVRTKHENGQVLIEIGDNGPGMSKKLQDKVMQPFFTTKQGTQGTGLGLSITNDILKAHGGTIDLTSELGEGTKFIIILDKT